MGIRFIKIATVYLVLGVIMGIVMGITRQFQFAPVHAHVNLLGWATFAIGGLVYVLFPAAAATRLATWHFWLLNIGAPVFMIGLFVVSAGNEAVVPVVVVGAFTTLAALLVFLINVFANVRELRPTA